MEEEGEGQAVVHFFGTAKDVCAELAVLLAVFEETCMFDTPVATDQLLTSSSGKLLLPQVTLYTGELGGLHLIGVVD